MKRKNHHRRAVPIVAGLLMIVSAAIYFFLKSSPLTLLSPSVEAQENPQMIDPCKDGLKSVETHAFLPKKFKILSMRPIADLCEIAIASDNKYVTLYAAKDYVMVGDLFKDQKAVTQALIETIEGKVLSENRASLEKCVALTYTPKDRNIHRSLFMVVTPGCHFCEEAEEEIEFLAERYGLTIKMILYDHKAAPASVAAVCRKIPISEFGSSAFKTANHDKDQCETAQKLLGDTIPVVDQIGIKGFPTFIFDTGSKVVGGNMQKLEQQIVMTLASIESELLTSNQGAE